MIGKFVPPVEFADDVQIKHSKTASMLNPQMFAGPFFSDIPAQLGRHRLERIARERFFPCRRGGRGVVTAMQIQTPRDPTIAARMPAQTLAPIFRVP